MKRRARERLPQRAAGAFPSYLYKSLDELEGVWPEPAADHTSLVALCTALHRKPLLLLADEEVGLALRQRIGLPWLGTLVILRLRQDPMRLAYAYDSGDMLRYALQLSRDDWGAQASDIEEIADAIVPNLPETLDHLALFAEYRRFKTAG